MKYKISLQCDGKSSQVYCSNDADVSALGTLLDSHPKVSSYLIYDRDGHPFSRAALKPRGTFVKCDAIDMGEEEELPPVERAARKLYIDVLGRPSYASVVAWYYDPPIIRVWYDPQLGFKLKELEGGMPDEFEGFKVITEPRPQFTPLADANIPRYKII